MQVLQTSSTADPAATKWLSLARSDAVDLRRETSAGEEIGLAGIVTARELASRKWWVSIL